MNNRTCEEVVELYQETKINYTYEDAMLAVKNGAYWLDENHPGWVERLDLSTLKLDSCHECVIGQAVGDFYDTVRIASGCLYYSPDGTAMEWAAQHGFDVPSHDDEDVLSDWYRILEGAWTAFVTQR